MVSHSLVMLFLRTVSIYSAVAMCPYTHNRQRHTHSVTFPTRMYTSVAVLEHLFGTTLRMSWFLFPFMFQEIPSEWHLELMLNRGLPEELWVHYVQQLHSAQRVAMEDSVLLVFSLKCFIFALKAPKSFPTGKARS